MSAPDTGPEEDPSVYDGHADYRKSFEPKPAGTILRKFVRVLLAIGVGVTFTWLTYKLLYPGPNIVVLFTGGIAFLVGLFGGAFFFSWLDGDENEQKPWGPPDAIAVAIIVFAFALPLSRERAREKREIQARSLERRAAELEHERQMAEYRNSPLARMRIEGRYAAPGVVPPGFEVRDSGLSVVMSNFGDRPVLVSLARVLRDPGSPGGWRGCSLWTTGMHGDGRSPSTMMDPGATVDFVMHDGCIDEFRGALLEFRIGDPTTEGEKGRQAWWSESALSNPEGRERETVRANALAKQRAGPESRLDSAPDGSYGAAQTPMTDREPAGAEDVIRCRDSSGAIQFTQRYCPPGTIRVPGPGGR